MGQSHCFSGSSPATCSPPRARTLPHLPTNTTSTGQHLTACSCWTYGTQSSAATDTKLPRLPPLHPPPQKVSISTVSGAHTHKPRNAPMPPHSPEVHTQHLIELLYGTTSSVLSRRTVIDLSFPPSLPPSLFADTREKDEFQPLSRRRPSCLVPERRPHILHRRCGVHPLARPP